MANPTDNTIARIDEQMIERATAAIEALLDPECAEDEHAKWFRGTMARESAIAALEASGLLSTAQQTEELREAGNELALTVKIHKGALFAGLPKGSVAEFHAALHRWNVAALAHTVEIKPDA